jgi:hypothetical protein
MNVVTTSDADAGDLTNFSHKKGKGVRKGGGW